MDNASGNHPNVPLSPGIEPVDPIGGPHSIAPSQPQNSAVPMPASQPEPVPNQLETVPQPEVIPAPQPDAMPAPQQPETIPEAVPLLPEAASPAPLEILPEPVQPPALGPETLTEDSILSSPTPVDSDPPPISDVPPPVPINPDAQPFEPNPQLIRQPAPISPPESPDFTGPDLEVLPDPLPIDNIPPTVDGYADESQLEALPLETEPLPIEAEPPPAEPLLEQPLLDDVTEDPSTERIAEDPNLLPPLLLTPISTQETEEIPTSEKADSDEFISELYETEPPADLPLEKTPEPSVAEETSEIEEEITIEPEASAELEYSEEPVTEETPIEAEPVPVVEQAATPDTRSGRVVVNPESESYVKNEFFVSEGAEDPWILPVGARGKNENSKREQKKAARTSKKLNIWQIVTSIFFFGGIGLLALLVIAYLCRGLIAKRVESNIAQKIEESGIYMDYEKWDYDPVRGIILRNLTVYEREDRVVPYAKINNVGFNTDIFALIKSKDPSTTRNTISFSKSHVQLFDKAEVVADINNFGGSVDLNLPLNLVGLENLKGQLENVNFNINGDIVLPSQEEAEVASTVNVSYTSSIATSGDNNQRPASSILHAIETNGNVDNVIKTAQNTAEVPTTIDVDVPLTSSEPSTPVVAKSNEDGTFQLPSLAFLRDIQKYFKVKTDGDLPVLTSNLSIDLSDPENQKISAKGRLTGKSLWFEEEFLPGFKISHVDVPYTFDSQKDRIDLSNFKMGHGPTGQITGNAQYWMNSKILGLDSVRSTVNLVRLLTDIDPTMKDSLKNLTFLDSPNIFIANGEFPIESPLNGQANFSYQQWAGLLIDIDGKSLPISEIRGNFKLARSILSIPSLKAKVMDGPTTAIGSIKIADPNFPFNGSVKVDGMPMGSIAKFANLESKYLKGKLNVDYQGSAGKEIDLLSGRGSLNLENSQLYKVPVIGPIQRLLGAAIPIFSPENSAAVSGNYIIQKGVLATSDLTVRSDGTKVAIKGKADLGRQLTAFSAKANLEGPLGLATGLVGELIELEGRGPLSRPQIRLKSGGLPSSFTSDKVKSILNIGDGSTEAMTAVLQDIAGDGSMGDFIRSVGGVGKAVEAVEGGVGGAASGVGEAASDALENLKRTGADRLRGIIQSGR